MTTNTTTTDRDDPTMYTAWRYPTEAEMDDGCGEEDMVCVGDAASRADAVALLRGTGGQVQLGTDGPVTTVDGPQ